MTEASSSALSREELATRARRLRLVLTDNDGVLTDTGVYYSERGEELKRYSVRDGMGVERLRRAGIETAIVTREAAGCIRGRAEKLKVRLYSAMQDKLTLLPMILTEYSYQPDQLGFIGDYVNDLELMEAVSLGGLTGAPSDAMPMVKRIALHLCASPGGHGAFRDFAEWILELRS